MQGRVGNGHALRCFGIASRCDPARNSNIITNFQARPPVGYLSASAELYWTETPFIVALTHIFLLIYQSWSLPFLPTLRTDTYLQLYDGPPCLR